METSTASVILPMVESSALTTCSIGETATAVAMVTKRERMVMVESFIVNKTGFKLVVLNMCEDFAVERYCGRIVQWWRWECGSVGGGGVFIGVGR